MTINPPSPLFISPSRELQLDPSKTYQLNNSNEALGLQDSSPMKLDCLQRHFFLIDTCSPTPSLCPRDTPRDIMRNRPLLHGRASPPPRAPAPFQNRLRQVLDWTEEKSDLRCSLAMVNLEVKAGPLTINFRVLLEPKGFLRIILLVGKNQIS